MIRSALYLPASNVRAIEKARSLPADAVIFDLEDAVAPQEKPQARRNLEAAFAAGLVASGFNVIRVNAPGSYELEADLETVRRCRPQAILLPKVENDEQLADLQRNMEAASHGPRPAVWCMVETALGLQRVHQIAAPGRTVSAGVQCLVIGTNDIARETGVSTADDRRYLLPWLMSAVLAAKASGAAILDGVWNDFKDQDGFAAEALQGRDMGFDGKTLIHPTQVEPANRIFSPSAEALAQARAIVAAFAEPTNVGKNVINLNGRMVERLHLQMAQTLLRTQEVISTRNERVA